MVLINLMKATIEPGLSGTGPLPVHLHSGKPTPWSEGCVVRIQPDSGTEWIGNLQRGYGYATKIIEWRAAKAIIVIAHGASYLIHPDQPEKWLFLDDLSIDCTITPHEDIALLATYSAVVAIASNGTVLWRRELAIDGVEITCIENGLIYGKACLDPPELWVPFALNLNKGFEVPASEE